MVEPAPDPKRQRLDEDEPEVAAREAAADDGLGNLGAPDEDTLDDEIDPQVQAELQECQDGLEQVRGLNTIYSTQQSPALPW